MIIWRSVAVVREVINYSPREIGRFKTKLAITSTRILNACASLDRDYGVN